MATIPERHLLDPLDGYDGDPAADDRRINLRRIQLSALLLAIDAVAEGIINIFRDIAPMWPVLLVTIVGVTVFAVRAKHAQVRPSDGDTWLVDGFVLFACCSWNALGYIGATHGAGDHIPLGVPMMFLAAASIFSIAPRRFLLIGSISFAVFATWVISLPMPVVVRAYALINGGLATIAGCLGRTSIARIQQIAYRSQAQVVARNAALHEANVALERHNEALNDLGTPNNPGAIRPKMIHCA